MFSCWRPILLISVTLAGPVRAACLHACTSASTITQSISISCKGPVKFLHYQPWLKAQRQRKKSSQLLVPFFFQPSFTEPTNNVKPLHEHSAVAGQPNYFPEVFDFMLVKHSGNCCRMNACWSTRHKLGPLVGKIFCPVGICKWGSKCGEADRFMSGRALMQTYL